MTDFDVLFSGEAARQLPRQCSNGGGLKEGPSRPSIAEVDDFFAPLPASTPKEQQTQTSTHSFRRGNCAGDQIAVMMLIVVFYCHLLR